MYRKVYFFAYLSESIDIYQILDISSLGPQWTRFNLSYSCPEFSFHSRCRQPFVSTRFTVYPKCIYYKLIQQYKTTLFFFRKFSRSNRFLTFIKSRDGKVKIAKYHTMILIYFEINCAKNQINQWIRKRNNRIYNKNMNFGTL